MKKILLAAAVCALASFNTFGAACADGILSGVVQPCQVTNGTYSWNLSNLGVFDTSSNGFLSPTNTTIANNLNVAFATAGSTGFSLTYSLNSPYNAWSAQDLQFLNGVWVTANNVESNVVRIGLQANYGAGNAYMGFEKEIQNQGTPSLVTYGSLNLTYPGAPVSVVAGADYIETLPAVLAGGISNLSVNDRLVFDAKTTQNGARAGSVVSYTNYFYAAEPQTGVPEPMTFVLMGAGLVGIAALRRRNG